MCCSYAGGCGRWAPFARRVGDVDAAGGAGGDALCASLFVEDAEGTGRCWKVLGVLERMRRVLFCILVAVKGGLCLLEVLEVMCCVLLRMLEAVEGGLYSMRCWRCRW